MMTGGHATRQILELNVDEPETQKLTDVALHEALAKASLGARHIAIVHGRPRCVLVLERDVRNFGLDLSYSAFFSARPPP